MKAKYSETHQLEARRRESEEGGSFLDMRIDVVFDGEIVLSVGGVWDRRSGEYVAGREAETAVVVEPHAGQMPALRWYIAWLKKHAQRRGAPPRLTEEMLEKLVDSSCEEDEVFSALCAGGRRGGKSWFGALCVALYVVAFPSAISWIVNASDSKHDEMRRYMAHLLSDDWITRQTDAIGWELANGSSISLKSAYTGADPDAIKEGEAHFILLNEAQKMDERVFVVARGAIVDSSGIVLCLANPPVESGDQQWVSDFAAEAQQRKRHAVYIHFNPLDNPHINREALLALKFEVDARTYRIEVLGEFLGPADAVCWNWIRTRDGNERPRPEPFWDGNVQVACPRTGLIDVTEQFLRDVVELGDGFTDMPGMDFQVHPHMGGPVYRFFCRPDQMVSRETVLVWGVDEVVISGDELDWCSAAKEKGYSPESTAIIGDGTGEYQHSRRGSADAPPPEWSGKGSFDIIRMGGFPHIFRPDPRIRNNNPHVIDRVRSLTSLVESAKKIRRLFFDPDRAPLTTKSLREWPTVHGKPSRIHEAAHLGDGASYPLIRVFPRIFRSGTPAAVSVNPLANLAERLDRAPLRAEPRRGRGRPRRSL